MTEKYWQSYAWEFEEMLWLSSMSTNKLSIASDTDIIWFCYQDLWERPFGAEFTHSFELVRFLKALIQPTMFFFVIFVFISFVLTQTDPCNVASGTNCSGCTSQQNCGWCSSIQACITGTVSGPAGLVCSLSVLPKFRLLNYFALFSFDCNT